MLLKIVIKMADFTLKQLQNFKIVILSFSVLFLSCTEDDVVTPITDAYVNILTPFEFESIVPGDDINFRAEVVADADINYQNLIATWISDKDGVLYENQLTENGFSSFTTNALSSNIHNISVNVKNEADSTLVDAIEIYNVLKLNPIEKDGSSLNISWSVSGDVEFESFVLYRSMFDEGILNQEPIFTTEDINQTSFEDNEALLGERHYYRVVLNTTSSQVVASNVESSTAGIFFRTNYPLGKIVYDQQRQKAYALVKSESIFDSNDTGWGLLFIDLTNFRAEKRILENIRFSDLDLGPNGNYLYLASRGNAVRKINLDTQSLEQTYVLQSPAHKIEVGNNNRLYYHITPPSSGSTEFRIYDLATGTDIPYQDTMTAAYRRFRHGDFEIDETETIFHGGSNSSNSRLSKLTTTNDVFSLVDQLGSNDYMKDILILNNDILYWNHLMLDKNLNIIGSFQNEFGDINTSDISPNGNYALIWNKIYQTQNQSLYKEIPAIFTGGGFVGDNKVIIFNNENPVTNTFKSTVVLFEIE
jgi:hypothetical protein